MHVLWIAVRGSLPSRMHLALSVTALACWVYFFPKYHYIGVGLFVLFFIASMNLPSLRALWPLWPMARSFRRLSRGGADVYFASGQWQDNELHAFVLFCEERLRHFTRLFGKTLRYRPAVFLMQTDQVAKICGDTGTGFASSSANVIVLSTSYELSCIEETAAHELAHLYLKTLTSCSAPLIREGLPTWLKRTQDGMPIHFHARVIIGVAPISLGDLLSRTSFDPDITGLYEYEHYILAGSFTGFLVDRFGWNTYLSFCRHVNDGSFRANFRETFGLDLEAAEREWHSDLETMCPHLEDNIADAIEEYRVEAAYKTGRLHECITEGHRLMKTKRVKSHTKQIVARAHRDLSQYTDAVKILEPMVKESLVKDLEHIQLADVYERAGKTAEAIAIYEELLETASQERRSDWAVATARQCLKEINSRQGLSDLKDRGTDTIFADIVDVLAELDDDDRIIRRR